MKRVPLAHVAPLLLAGCGQDGAAANQAAALERAADQSSPEAADILRNADPGANVHEVMPAAGNAQAAAEAPTAKSPAEGSGH